MLKRFLNTLYFLCGIYCFGIIGSMDIGRLTFGEGLGHFAGAFVVTAIVYVFAHLAIIAKLLIKRQRTLRLRAKKAARPESCARAVAA